MRMTLNDDVRTPGFRRLALTAAATLLAAALVTACGGGDDEAAAVGKAAEAAQLTASEVTLPPHGSNVKDTTNLALLVYDDDDLDDEIPY